MTNRQLSRRRFVQDTSAALAAAALAVHVRGQEQPPAKKVGYALVGLGQLTLHQLMPAFAKCEKSRAVALVSGHPDKARQVADQYGVDPKAIYNYENFDTLKENPAVDVVYVVLPNGMHAEYTIRAASAGKHVLCEKPMANSVADCRRMIDACKAANKKLMIAYRLRHEPFNQKAIDICRNKTYGPLKLIEADHGFNIPAGTWRTDKKLAGGGPLPDVGVYCINAARYLTGEEPIELGATLTQPKDDPRFKEVEESAAWWMRFPGGTLANCTTTYGSNGGSRYHFNTPEAFIQLDPAFAYHGLRMQIRARGNAEKVDLPDVDQFAAEMDHFSDCVMNDKPPITPGEEGQKDVGILQAIYESAAGGKAVKLS